MPKLYRFRFNACPCEFSGGFASVAITESIGEREIRDCTLADGLAYLAQYSARIAEPHAAFMGLANPRDRKPAGYDKAITTIYNRGSACASNS